MTLNSDVASRKLLDFSAEQKQSEIGNIKVGGKPGMTPTALIGSIFYHGHKVFIDEDKDEFDLAAVEQLVKQQDEWSQRTGNPCMLDVVGATPEALCTHLEVISSLSETPILLDGTTSDVRLAGLEYAAKAGLMDRIVYNSIQPEIQDDEWAAIREFGLKHALILTYNMMDFTAKGRVQSVQDLLPKIKEAGIENVLVDTCVLDLATLGQAFSAIFDVKEKFGVPAGGGVHNAVAMWGGLKTKMGEQAEKPCIASVCAATVAIGADFALYGPVEDAQYVFPAVAMVDTALSQLHMEYGIRPDANHPRFKIG